MQKEAKATHHGMLHQFRALWAKAMRIDAVHDRTLGLNDLCIPGEVTVTARAVV